MTTLELLKVTKAVWGSIRDASPEEKNRILLAMADALQQETDSILAANEQDMDKARGGISEVMLDRLRLDPARIDGMADGIRATVRDCACKRHAHLQKAGTARTCRNHI